MRTPLVLVALVLSACSSSSNGNPDLGGNVGDGGGAVDMAPNPLVEARPYSSHIPPSYDGSKPYPLVILLHGFSADGLTQDLYFGLDDTSDERGFLLAYPDGTPGSDGKRFWDAASACCRFTNPPVDDVAYLNAIIDDMSARYLVDAKRVYFIGHSNGGFMSHRMACDASRRVAGIVSLAGTLDDDDSKCVPTDGVAILQVHGDADATIPYNGSTASGFAFPGAKATMARWATKNACPGALTATGETLDLDTVLAGAETLVEKYSGCTRGVSASELWTIRGGSHIPNLAQPEWGRRIYDWLYAFKKQ